MTWEQAERTIGDRVEKALADEAIRFNMNLLLSWPVDTGFSRRAWKMEKAGKTKWVFTNDVSYSPILWAGRRFDGRRWQGSTQMPAGGEPILETARHSLYRRLSKIA